MSIDKNVVMSVGAHVMATHYPKADSSIVLDRLADYSVRAAVALEAAVTRAETKAAYDARLEASNEKSMAEWKARQVEVAAAEAKPAKK